MTTTKSTTVSTSTTVTISPISLELGREALQARLDQAVKEREYQEAQVSTAEDDIAEARAGVGALENGLMKKIAELNAAKLVEKLIEDAMAARGYR